MKNPFTSASVFSSAADKAKIKAAVAKPRPPTRPRRNARKLKIFVKDERMPNENENGRHPRNVRESCVGNRASCLFFSWLP